LLKKDGERYIQLLLKICNDANSQNKPADFQETNCLIQCLIMKNCLAMKEVHFNELVSYSQAIETIINMLTHLDDSDFVFDSNLLKSTMISSLLQCYNPKYKY